MQTCLNQELKRLLSEETITTLFQPIVNVGKKAVFGYEALSRGPSDSNLHGAQMLFETAERCGLTSELDGLCLRTAANSWSGQGTQLKLFVNVSPAKLTPPEFKPSLLQELLEANRLKPSDIVIELSERYPTADPSELLKTLSWLKTEGFLIAIDDLGSGYSGLKLWSELEPDFVKIDRHFIRDIQDDLVKREFLRSVVELSDRIGCKLIAEGVETEAEFRVVAGLGISLVQGFLFGRPKQIATACLDPLRVQPAPTIKVPREETAGSLISQIEPVTSYSTMQYAWERLQSEPGLFALPVVDNGRPLGLLHKWRVLETFSTPYGRALYEKCRVTRMLNADALVVDCDMPLDEVSQRLIDDDAHYLKQHFIVTHNGRYAGLGSTRALLQKITIRKIEKARYANPLTLLPGNVPIQQTLATRTDKRLPFTLIYFDINMFKPLNDSLGYRVGDQVILLLADLLTEFFHVDGDFVGHIGGDDFVVISTSPLAISNAKTLQARFVEQTRRFYTESVLRNGFVESEDRSGQINRFPLVSLAAGIVEVNSDDRHTADQLSDAASHAKKRAKATVGFCFIESAGALTPASQRLAAVQ
ncbi:MAG: GGDEF domain-containing protein [Marinobacter sp.]|uniref:GGDEF domain-containing protein n=1 Tax=Marinobacter sp. TaxID=50741 RepID=UPI0035695B5E